MADMDFGYQAESVQSDGSGGFSILFNWLGALMSVALIAGLAVWGYQLMMRDVTGVPVVRALEGPMRIAPEDPGGQRAAHQGLAVNSVAEAGSAEGPTDRVILAPEPIDVTDEDLPRPILAETPSIETATAVETAPEQPTDMASLAESLVEGVQPLSATIQPETIGDDGIDIIPASVRGVSRSPLPRPRPAGDLTALAVANTVARATTVSASLDVDASSVPVGTRLVQFGAFDSPEAARSEWDKLDGRFADFLDGKSRVIQRAVSGGKTFYRLRAMGFADINDARRFCSALLAERQACIPVVTR